MIARRLIAEEMQYISFGGAFHLSANFRSRAKVREWLRPSPTLCEIPFFTGPPPLLPCHTSISHRCGEQYDLNFRLAHSGLISVAFHVGNQAFPYEDAKKCKGICSV